MKKVKGVLAVKTKMGEEPKCLKWELDWYKVKSSCNTAVVDVYQLVQKMCPEFKVDLEKLENDRDALIKCVNTDPDKEALLHDLYIFNVLINLLLLNHNE